MSIAKYKFAIMLNGLYMYPWQKLVYDQIVNENLADCCLFIIKKEKNQPTTKKGFFSKLANPHLLFEQFKKSKLNPSIYKQIPLNNLAQIATIEIEPEHKGKSVHYISEKDISVIQSHQLDFILRFGFGILKGDILKSAKWGIWSFHHGDEQEFRGGPAGFWEIFKNRLRQGVILQQLTEKLDAGKIILKRHYSVVRHSYAENVAKLLIQSADMPAQALRMISEQLISIDNLESTPTNAPIYHYPSNFKFILFQLKVLLNRIKFKWTTLFKQENWIIGYRTNNDDKYAFIAPPKDGEYYADPFVFKDNNKPYIVAEHYSYKTKKGSIVLIEPGMNKVKTLIEKETHLSYPFIFEEDNSIYMLPEECKSGQLNLYKWNKTTTGFEFVQTLLELPAVDASILKHEGKYYIFLGIQGYAPNDKLYIYYSDQLLGPYQPHLSNPVKVSPEGSRMAGGFIINNNEIIRPSQYSVKYYGEKVVFQKILTLTPSEYKESYLNELQPMSYSPYTCGLHTYHKKDELEVIDLKTMRSSYIAFKSQL